MFPKTFYLLPLALYLTLSSCSLAFAQASTDEAAITEAVNLTSDGEALVYKEFVGLDDLQAGLKLFQQSLAIFKKYGAKGGEANSLVDIGYVYLREGEYPKALESFESALAIHKATGNRQDQWIPLSYMGEVYVDLGDYSHALEFYQPALTILKELKTANPKDSSYSTNEEITLADMGAVYFRLGQYQKALDFYQQSLAIQKQDSNYSGSMETLNNIGVVYVNLGNYPQALDAYQQALTILQSCCSGFYGTKAAIFNNQSSIYYNLGQYQKSLELAQQAANIYQKLPSSNYQGTKDKQIELLYNALSENPQALQQLTSRANVGDAFGPDAFQFQGEALNLNNVGQIYFSLGKYDEAVKLYQQALNIYQQHQYKPGIATTLTSDLAP
jgi:tetratricopeptide (TPR) repeat protein